MGLYSVPLLMLDGTELFIILKNQTFFFCFFVCWVNLMSLDSSKKKKKLEELGYLTVTVKDS